MGTNENQWEPMRTSDLATRVLGRAPGRNAHLATRVLGRAPSATAQQLMQSHYPIWLLGYEVVSVWAGKYIEYM